MSEKIIGFDKIFLKILNDLKINSDDNAELVAEFEHLDDNKKYQLLSSVGEINEMGAFNPNYEMQQLLEADKAIQHFEQANSLDHNKSWLELKKELSILQVNSIIKLTQTQNIDEFFDIIRNKVDALNKLIRADRGLSARPAVETGRKKASRKYLKYKQKYLKLKNDMNN